MSGMQAALSRIAGIEARVQQLAPTPRPGFEAVLDRALRSGPAGTLQRVEANPVGGFWSSVPGPAAPVRWAGISTVRAPAPDQAWRERLPESAGPYLDAIEDAAARAGIDARLLAAVAWAESTFVPDAVSHAGAIGLTQLMPATAESLGVDPYDPAENLAGGARYLREQLDRFGSTDLMLAAYNAGPGTVQRAGGIPDIAETEAYLRRVIGYYQQLVSRPADHVANSAALGAAGGVLVLDVATAMPASSSWPATPSPRRLHQRTNRTGH